MGWRIELTATATKSLVKMNPKAAEQIYRALKEISERDDPRSAGKALTGNLKGLWRYRIGDYRAVCEIQDERLVVLVIDVAHRKDIYRRQR